MNNIIIQNMYSINILIVSLYILNTNLSGLAYSEVNVNIPTDMSPKKEALFWQRQLVILFVPTNLGGVVPGAIPVAGGVGPGGVPIGGLPVGGGGFNARLNRNVDRLRTLRRRTRVRVTTANYESIDSEK